MSLKSHSIRRIPASLVAVAVAALGFATTDIAVAAPSTSGGAQTGGSCTVTAGANKGKTGTYTTEEGTGHTWCEGSWGGTDCTGDRCKSNTMGLPTGTLPIVRPGTLSFLR
jgi:hypothetical protein